MMRSTARRSAIDRPVSPELIARFAADLTACGNVSRRLGLAISGGPDSLALLLLARAAFPRRIFAATVDHGLRVESAAEAETVSRICAWLGVRHATLKVVVPRGNVQAQARDARYFALGEWARSKKIGDVLTAHHTEDQAETLIMRLVRGSGVYGLAAMRRRAHMPKGADIGLLRPLLGWRRAELSEVVAAAGLVPCDDPSNHDERFDRVRTRVLLSDNDWIDPARVAESASHLRDAADAINWAAEMEFDANVEFQDGYAAIYRPKAPKAVRLEVVQLLIDNLGMEGQPRGSGYARLLATLEQGGVATLGGMRVDGREPGVWRFTQAPARRS